MATDWITKAKDLMRQRGITQQDLVPVMGKTTRGAIGHYFTGRSEPSLEQLEALAKFLGVSINYLIGNEESAINKTMLEQCVEIVEEVATEHGVDLTSHQTAKIVAYLYQANVEASKAGREAAPDRDEVFDLMHLIT